MAPQSDKLRLLRRIPDIRFEQESNGYSKDQVDRVLANLAPLADEIERLQARLTEAENRAASAEARLIEARSPSQSAPPGAPPAPMPDFDETLRNTLVNAQRTADTTVREAKEEAERLRNEAEFQSNALLADARDQATELTTEAVSQRERMLSDAASERAQMLDAAREEAQGRVDAVEEELAQAHEAERARLLEQIADLQHIHGLLQGDVSRFEQHLEARRSDVKKAMDELNAVLDDPEMLRSRDALEPAEIGVVDTTDYPPIAVEVKALDELEVEASEALEETSRPNEAIHPEDLEELAPNDNDVNGDGMAHEAEINYEADMEEELEANLELDAELAAAVPENGSGVVHMAEPDMMAYVEDESLAEPAMGMADAVVAEPVAAMDQVHHGNGMIAQVAQMGNEAAPPPPTGDPFLDELRRVTTEEPGDGDPITDFLEDDGVNRGGSGWFGRRK